MTLLESALQYSDQFNYPIIPVNPENKKPLIKWLDFQNRKATKEEINEWWNKWPDAMIGGVTGQISHDFVIDVDNPQGDEALSEYLPESLLTPTAITPRGGKHLHFEHPQDNITIKAGLLPHVDYRGQGGFIILPPSCNSNGKKYQWVNGLSLEDLPRSPLPDMLLSYIKELASSLYRKEDLQVIQGHKLFQKGTRDDDLFHIANQLVRSNTDEGTVRQVLEILALNCNPPFPHKEISDKISSALSRASRKERNLTEDVEHWVSLTKGLFSLTEAYISLQILTPGQKNAVHQVMHRLCEKGFIERVPPKNGVYRRIEEAADEINFMGVEEKIIEISWPFEIEKWVKILPKNIIVVAGEPNAGKTAFLLNTCFLNMGRFKINYYSSEMGAMELRDRLKKFGEHLLTHWKENINFRERSLNFADVTKPNDVNIIDFLEITDEFYKIGGMIKEIYDKLKKGIAIIALQKNPHTDFGLGGMRSIEKARLYLSIETGKIKIVKGKNWAEEGNNPNGIYNEFKLYKGAKFVSQGGWKRD